MAAPPTLKVTIDHDALDQLRALIKSLGEAADKLTACAMMAADMAEQLTVTSEPAALRKCPVCTGKGLPVNDCCAHCGGLGFDLADPTAEVAVDVVASGPVPEQRQPSPIWLTGISPGDLCPECRSGKLRNCAYYRDAEGGVCAIRQAYLDDTSGDARTFGAWLTERGLP